MITKESERDADLSTVARHAAPAQDASEPGFMPPATGAGRYPVIVSGFAERRAGLDQQIVIHKTQAVVIILGTAAKHVSPRAV